MTCHVKSCMYTNSGPYFMTSSLKQNKKLCNISCCFFRTVFVASQVCVCLIVFAKTQHEVHVSFNDTSHLDTGNRKWSIFHKHHGPRSDVYRMGHVTVWMGHVTVWMGHVTVWMGHVIMWI